MPTFQAGYCNFKGLTQKYSYNWRSWANTGADGVERYVEDGIATFVDNLHIQGARQKEIYYEEVFSAQMMQPTYNVFVMLEMSKADYLKCKADALKTLRDRFSKEGRTEAKEKAERLLDELKKGIQRDA